MKRLWQSPLARELGILLVVKIALIITIKLVFFNDPPHPDDAAVARALLNPAATASNPQQP